MIKRSEVRPHVIPEIKDWPVNKLYKKRKDFAREVSEFTIHRIMTGKPDEVSKKIARAAYLETNRIKDEPWKVDPVDEKQFWNKMRKNLVNHSLGSKPEDMATANEKLLRKIVDRYSEEIVGGFKPSTFKFARKFLLQFFKVIFNTAWSLGKGRIFGNRRQLHERMKVYGHVEDLRSLMKKGTVILVPTHFSNLDSIMIGYALDEVVGVPSFTYGAGLNLFNNKIVAYFMNRLGAYRLDRRKKNKIYLETLKAMSNLAIQRGTNCLFFPGGTRSRSGKLETRLKLGLLGTAVEAQRVLMQKGFERKVYIVPMVIGYHFVLEGKSLVQQHLKKTGEELFIPPKLDESLSIRKIIRFAWQFFSRSSEITVSFGQPLDVVGNYVDKEGVSMDKNGNPLDLKGYFSWNGEVNADFQRESEYTRKVAGKIVESFYKDNIVMSSHLIALAAFLKLRKQNPKLDIYAILRLPLEEFELSESDFVAVLDELKEQLVKLEENDKIKLSEEIRWDSSKLLRDGLENIGLYHTKNPLGFNKKGNIISEDFSLLYFYHNRLDGFGLKLN
ncbi:MAG: glycerol-3-phosphate O-acyltransferase [Maribacter sp.]|jgi:glycerol-3-phosphate O-acyltransferase